jgi:RNA polymerase sigma-70 factor, ECF subfamily
MIWPRADRQHCVVHQLKNLPAKLPKAQPYRLRLVHARGAAVRQLASRAAPRARLTPAPDPNIARQREVVDAFLAASRAGDFEALVSVLDPEVVFGIDSGGIGPEARPPIIGAPAVAERLLARGARFAPQAKPAIVNGTAG